MARGALVAPRTAAGVPGVFAVGDMRAGANRRVVAAVGEGSAAVFTIQRYLDTL